MIPVHHYTIQNHICELWDLRGKSALFRNISWSLVPIRTKSRNRDFSASTVCQPCAKDFLCDLSSRYKHCSTVTDSGIGLTLLPQAMGTKKFKSGDPIGTLTLSEMGTFFGRNGDRTAYFRQINRNELTS